jgi:hypothetical protein
MNILCGIFIILSIAYALTDNKIKDIFWSFMYMIIFPFIYIIWGIALLVNLIGIPIKSEFR